MMHEAELLRRLKVLFGQTELILLEVAASLEEVTEEIVS